MSGPAASLLAAWRRLLEAAPDAPLCAEGASGRWTSRAGVEALRRAWLERLPPAVGTGRAVFLQEENGPGWLGLVLALWTRGAIAIPLDPLTREAERDRLAAAINPIACVVGERITIRPSRRSWRAPVVLGKVTSGSTGTPKTLLFSAAEMAADGAQVEAGMGIGEGDCNLAAIPFGHSYGLGNLVLPALTRGRPVVCASAVFPRVLVAEAAGAGATVFPATPPLLKGLLRAGMRAADWPGLHLVISAGARLDPVLARAFAEEFGRPIHNFYGSSETGGIAFDRTGEHGLTGGAVGEPLPGVTLRTTATGRLCVASAAVARYRNRRRVGAQAAVVLADRGGLDPAGAVVLRGRLSQLLKIGARRVDPHEIERVLRAVPGVTDCVVAACPVEGGEALGAVVAGSASRSALRAAARAGLAAWKVPKRLRVVPELPHNARGKVDRAAVLALLGEQE